MNYGCDWKSVVDVSGMIYITIYVKEVRVFLICADLSIYWFEVTLVGALVTFMNYISWLHDGFMWMVHEVFHDIFEIDKIRFCWCIYIATEADCDILEIIAILDSDVHESTTQWFSDPPYYLSIFFSLSLMRCVSMKSVCSKGVSTGNGDYWNFSSSFVFGPQYYWTMFFMM